MDWDRCSVEDATAWVRLGLATRAGEALALLRQHGTPHSALAALRPATDAAAVERALRWLEAPGHHLVALGDARYPQALLNIEDPPCALYVRGDPALLGRSSLAIVGSRNATPQGIRDAEAFAQALSAAGLAIVSGLALGIDAAAHRGGLAARGSSIAVLGTGADLAYPRHNAPLFERLSSEGAVVTEFALGTPPFAGNFPRRNRLISGLARGVLVVEAAMQSGSLVTARLALQQNREVFAIPGSIHSTVSKGCHWLIKEGAKLVERADDILAELGIERPAAPPSPPARKADRLLEAMGHAPITMDAICERTGLDAARLAASLARLELEGRVATLEGGLFQRLEPA